jgi:hypothetical protein
MSCQYLGRNHFVEGKGNIPVLDVTIGKYTINAYQMALVRPGARIVAEVTEEEVDLEGAIQRESVEISGLLYRRFELLALTF